MPTQYSASTLTVGTPTVEVPSTLWDGGSKNEGSTGGHLSTPSPAPTHQKYTISPEERRCLEESWKAATPEGVYCSTTWDTLYCWPATQAGTTVKETCATVFKDLPDLLNHPEAFAYRECDLSGTWQRGGWTNYSQCLSVIEHQDAASSGLREAVRLVTFIGALLSLLTLTITLTIFTCFREVATRADAALPEDSCLDPSVYIACDNLLLPARTLECDRLRVHRNLVVSLVIRFLVMLILTEPFISHRHTNTYRDVDWLCKLLLALRLYAQISSVNWMFVEGLFLHSRLTSNVFDSGAPFFIYYCIGWGWPMVLLVAWTTTMILHHHAPCWQGYSALKYVWILVAPMITVLMINLVFLVNIVRILVTKLQASDTQVRKAIKATAVLFPLLGITNLLFAVNPGGKGDLEGAYMLTNALFQSSQGVFVSVLYCFLNGEVQELVQKKWQQYRLQQLDKPGGPHRRSTRGTIIFEPSLSLRMSPNTSTSLQISPQTPTSQPLSPQSLSFQPVNIQTFNLQTLNHIYEVHQSGPLISRLLPSSEQCTQVHTYTEHDLMMSSV